MYENEVRNNQATYQNSVDKYNAGMNTLTRNSQIASNFANKVQALGTAKAQTDANDMSFGLLMAQYPEGVRKLIAKQMSMGRSFKTAIKIALG